MVFGVILAIVALALLWNNERKKVRISHLLAKAKRDCLSIDSRNPTQGNNFKLVYVSGMTENRYPVTDKEFGVEVDNSVKLVREVEMYQWVETSRKENERTYFTYNKKWVNYHVASDNFKESAQYSNPS